MKRAIVILLVPLLLASWLSMSVMRGDVSGDGRIDLADAILSVKRFTAAAVEEGGGPVLCNNLGAVISAFKSVAGLGYQIGDQSKKSQISKMQTSLFALLPSIESPLYKLTVLLHVAESTGIHSIIMDLTTPPPRFS